MAINQAQKLLAGLTLSASIESPVEPGQPRKFLDTAKGVWAADGTTSFPAPHDPAFPEVYQVQVPSAQTRGMSGVFRATLFDPTKPPGEQVATQWDFTMMDGDDGGLGTPSVDIPIWGKTIRVFGAHDLNAAKP